MFIDEGWQRSWTLRGMASDYLVVLGANLSQRDESRPIPGAFASLYLREWLDEAPDSVIWEMDEALGGRRPSGISVLRWERQRPQVMERLTEAFHSGALVALTLEREPRGTAHSAAKSTTTAPEPSPELSFLVIELADEDGKPVGGARYRVVLPNGAKRDGQLNSNGYARLDNVAPGSCQITFPDFDGGSWGSAKA